MAYLPSNRSSFIPLGDYEALFSKSSTDAAETTHEQSRPHQIMHTMPQSPDLVNLNLLGCTDWKKSHLQRSHHAQKYCLEIQRSNPLPTSHLIPLAPIYELLKFDVQRGLYWIM